MGKKSLHRQYFLNAFYLWLFEVMGVEFMDMEFSLPMFLEDGKVGTPEICVPT